MSELKWVLGKEKVLENKLGGEMVASKGEEKDGKRETLSELKWDTEMVTLTEF